MKTISKHESDDVFDERTELLVVSTETWNKKSNKQRHFVYNKTMSSDVTFFSKLDQSESNNAGA